MKTLSSLFIIAVLFVTALAISAFTEDCTEYTITNPEPGRYHITSSAGTDITAKAYVDGLISCDWSDGSAIVSRVVRNTHTSKTTDVIVYNRNTGDSSRIFYTDAGAFAICITDTSSIVVSKTICGYKTCTKKFDIRSDERAVLGIISLDICNRNGW
jgi:tricorn protease-like protein